jgi:phosphatidate cytidylyltransferase
VLKQRILTALILIPLVLWGLFALPLFYFALTVGAISFVAALEWAGLTGIATRLGRITYAILLVALAMGIYYTSMWLYQPVLIMAMVWWLWSLALIILYSVHPSSVGFLQSRWVVGLIGLFVLLPVSVGFMVLRASPFAGAAWILYVFLLVWAADTGAYFAGKRFGKHKLAAKVSPGKTLEGLAGAFALSAIVIVCGKYYFAVPVHKLALFVMWSVATVIISILGDLVESLFKRLRGVKDSGCFLPGHGGLLDRIDSLTAAIPFFAFGHLFGWVGS